MNLFFKVTLLFIVLFDLSFKILPIISTGKIGVLLLTIYFFLINKKKITINKKEAYIFVLYFFIFTHAILVFILNGMPETKTIARLLYYFIYSVWLSYVCIVVFRNRMDFFKTLSIVVFVQSCFVIVSWLSIDFRVFIDSLLVQTGNLSLLSAQRPPGLMNSAGAKASVILGIGSAITFYQLTCNNSKKSVLIYSFMFMVSTVSTLIVGRTGLLLLMVLVSTILIQNGRQLIFTYRFLKIVVIFTLVIIITILIIPESVLPLINHKVNWIVSEFSDGLFKAKTLIYLQQMTIKELDISTLIGTSQIRLPGGQHDSGYIQNYHSLGLIFTIIFYGIVLFHLLTLSHISKNFVKRNRLFIVVFISSLFIIEYKEPFVLSYSFLFILFTMLRIQDYKENKKIKIGENYEY
ncbi:hypothetical protein RJG79_10015 [Mycoplasmatota bacterium WC44]